MSEKDSEPGTDAALPAVVAEAVDAARSAGLHYVREFSPGIRRLRSGKGFRYVSAEGRTIRDRVELTRIRGLVIPPAWTEVWISPSPRGHIQAVGRDARRRKQYRYHSQWREVRDETKFGQLVAFGKALPAIRRRVDKDLARKGLPREKILATVVRLLETTLIRIGNEEYARANRSFGLTTLRDHHADVTGSTIKLQFRGKTGKLHVVRAQRSAAREDRESLPRHSGLRAVSIRRRRRQSSVDRFGGRERVPARDLRSGLHRQTVPDLGGDGSSIGVDAPRIA